MLLTLSIDFVPLLGGFKDNVSTGATHFQDLQISTTVSCK